MNMTLDKQLELPWDAWEDALPKALEWDVGVEAPAILVIDDDPLFAELFVEYARKHGHFATYYQSLTELGALSKLKHYHVALVDYDLGPGIDGLLIAEIFKDFDPEFPVVLTSATREGREHGMAYAGIIQEFVRKQEGLSTILNCVTSVVKRSNNSHEGGS
jgi:DNA-binding NtrC family response regulator